MPTATFTQTAVSLPAYTSTAAFVAGFVSATPTSAALSAGNLVETPTPKPVGGAGKVGSGFPWWLLAAGGAAAYTVSKHKQIAQSVSNLLAKKQSDTDGKDYLKVIKTLLSNYQAWRGLSVALQKALLPLPLEADYRFQELSRHLNQLTPEEYKSALFDILDHPERNWAAIADLLKKQIPSTVESGLSGMALLETLAGKTVNDPAWAQVLTTHGQVTSGSVNIEQAARLFIRLLESPEAQAGKDLIRGPVGKVFMGVQVFLGGWTYYDDMKALWSNPALDPRVSGEGVWVERIGTGLEGLGGGLLAVGGLMALLASFGIAASLAPLAAVLLPIGLALGGIGLIMKHWDSISSALVNGWNAWKGNFQQMGEITRKLASRAASALAKTIPAVGNAAGDTIVRVSQSAANVTRAVSTTIANTARTIGNAAANLTQKASAAASNTVRAIGNAAATVTRTLSNAVGSTVSRASASLASVVERVTSSVSSPLVQKVGRVVSNGITRLGNAVGSSIQRIGNTVAGIQQRISNGLANGIQRIGNTVANMQRSAGNAVGNAIQRVGDTIANTQQKIGNAIGTGVKKLTNAIGQWFAKKP